MKKVFLVLLTTICTAGFTTTYAQEVKKIVGIEKNKVEEVKTVATSTVSVEHSGFE